MAIHEHAREFAGLPVVDWHPARPIDEPERYAQRLTLGTPPRRVLPAVVEQGCLGWLFGKTAAKAHVSDDDDDEPRTFAQFLDDPNVSRVPAIVVTQWEGEEFTSASPEPVVEELVAARDRLASLRAIFLVDMTAEECEITWINQCDLSPLIAAYPKLEHLRVRGSLDLEFGTLRHPALKSLVVEAGGVDAPVIKSVGTAELPELEYLELWLGQAAPADHAGAVAELRPILSGERFPKLRRLGLRNSDIADDIARALAVSPLLRQLDLLDLSLGTFGDEGAAALIDSGALGGLKKLDIHHHFCSEAMVARLKSIVPDVDASERQEPSTSLGRAPFRYVAVWE